MLDKRYKIRYNQDNGQSAAEPLDLIVRGRFTDSEISMQERKKVALSKKTKNIIFGTVFGDGYLNKRGKNIRLQLVHGPKQKEYIEWKYENLLDITTDRGLKFETFNDRHSKSGKKSCWSFYTSRHEYLDYIYDLFYKNKKKVISEEVLNKLNPLSLATWIMDDGSLQKRKGRIRKDGTRIYVGARFVLCTYTKDLKIEKLICKKLKELFDLDFKVQKHYDNYRIVCTTGNFKKLVKIIKPHIIPSMEYKIDTSFLGKEVIS